MGELLHPGTGRLDINPDKPRHSNRLGLGDVARLDCCSDEFGHRYRNASLAVVPEQLGWPANLWETAASARRCY
ncbi:hypothetical protein KFK09_010691 [Dendrobium nobile]|uniref:Uncharacterized protein n=1 Tax=Dendrobium nobile TaxID=94219 RepID=A0A8T3BDG3_DENNO|nr:hypothetical protein KFK09_010691 [Dendrobium nobile]